MYQKIYLTYCAEGYLRMVIFSRIHGGLVETCYVLPCINIQLDKAEFKMNAYNICLRIFLSLVSLVTKGPHFQALQF
jgi:hypothetical protein